MVEPDGLAKGAPIDGDTAILDGSHAGAAMGAPERYAQREPVE
jgi:hypothetical protein